MTFRLGLTGSMGMGKTTTARIFAEEGCAVWNADAAVHRLYGPGGGAVAPMTAAFPQVVRNGTVSRDLLKAMLEHSPEALAKIEAIVHPLVAADRMEFLESTDAEIAVFDIPLLFETGADNWLDAVVCVTAAPDIQRARVMERGTMTEAQFDTILAKQMPDADKRARADYVIETTSIEDVRTRVKDVMQDIRSKSG